MRIVASREDAQLSVKKKHMHLGVLDNLEQTEPEHPIKAISVHFRTLFFDVVLPKCAEK